MTIPASSPQLPTSRRTRTSRAVTGLAAGLCSTAMILVGAGPAAAQTSGDPPASASPLHATPTEKAAAKVRPAIVYLTETFTGYVADQSGDYFNNGQPYKIEFACTGFGVNPNGYIATAGHCVDATSADGIRLDFITAAARDVVAAMPELALQDVVALGRMNWAVEGEAKGSPVTTEISVLNGAVGATTQAHVMPARVVDFRPIDQGDVALLKVEATDLPTIELAGDAEVQIGTPLLSVGYPGSADAITDPSLEPSNKDGQISSKKTVGTVPVYEISAALTPGMSGGATVSLDGEVLGINSFMPSGETQAFNFIAPAAGLSELLSRNGVHNELGPNDRLYNDGLTAYYGGRYTEAISDLDKLLQVAPQHAQAVQFRAAAAKAKQQFGEVTPAPPAPAPVASDLLGLPPLAFWAMVGFGGTMLITGVVFIARRRRHQNRPAPGAPVVTAAEAWTARANQNPIENSTWPPPAPASTVTAMAGDNTTAAPAMWPAAPNHATVLTPSRPGRCIRCGTETPPSAAFCATCGLCQRP